MTAPVKKVQIRVVTSHEFHSALPQHHETFSEAYLEIVSGKLYIFKTVFKNFQIVQAFVFVVGCNCRFYVSRETDITLSVAHKSG